MSLWGGRQWPAPRPANDAATNASFVRFVKALTPPHVSNHEHSQRRKIEQIKKKIFRQVSKLVLVEGQAGISDSTCLGRRSAHEENK
jgi:hypothetical protein